MEEILPFRSTTTLFLKQCPMEDGGSDKTKFPWQVWKANTPLCSSVISVSTVEIESLSGLEKGPSFYARLSL